MKSLFCFNNFDLPSNDSFNTAIETTVQFIFPSDFLLWSKKRESGKKGKREKREKGKKGKREKGKRGKREKGKKVQKRKREISTKEKKGKRELLIY